MALQQSALPASRLQPASSLRIWREALVIGEWVSLHTSPVYYGWRVPRGDGSPVIVVPGFMGSDRYLLDLYLWLMRIGYKPYYSGMGRNVDCPELLMRRLTVSVQQANAETGRPVRLLGHSLGGTIARTVAARNPAIVSQVIALGSPVAFARVHPAVLATAGLVRRRIGRKGSRPEGCYTQECECEFAESAGMRLPASIARTAIYTKADGVVDWRCCLEDDDESNIEVRGTHVGLAFNAQVYRKVAEVLAEVKA